MRDAKSSHVVRAWFGPGHPFLSRASPLLLAHVSDLEEELAISFGTKKLILYLLNMLKEDADVTFSDKRYRYQFWNLGKLEAEIEDRINA